MRVLLAVDGSSHSHVAVEEVAERLWPEQRLPLDRRRRGRRPVLDRRHVQFVRIGWIERRGAQQDLSQESEETEVRSRVRPGFWSHLAAIEGRESDPVPALDFCCF